MPCVVQYVIVRGDLSKVLNWPLGAIIAQCCHATSAVGHIFHDDPDTKTYFSDLDNMHKVVLEAPDEAGLLAVGSTLAENGICHKMWIEQPENIPTCIAVKPYSKDVVHKYLKKLKLLK